jgi:Outer membrane protein beta-barrel domain
MVRHLGAVAVSWLMVMCIAEGRAGAQPLSRFYVGGAAGVFSVDADAVSGRSASGGVAAGVAVKPWLDLEADLVIPTAAFTRTYGSDSLSLSFAPAGAPQEEHERLGVWTRFDTMREVTASVSGAAIFHAPVAHRVDIGFIAGVTAARVRDRYEYTPVRIGTGVDPSHPSVRARVETHARFIGAPTIGVNLGLSLTPHLTLVPDLRYDYGSIGDELNNTLRSSIRVLWHF